MTAAADPKGQLANLIDALKAGKVPSAAELVTLLTPVQRSIGVLSSYADRMSRDGIGLTQQTMPATGGDDDRWHAFLEQIDAQVKVLALSAITQSGFKRDRRTTLSINETLARVDRTR
jgi:hypothetical protein